MTVEFEDYLTRDLMKQGKDRRNSDGWVSFHTDFINNRESDGFRVTYVNGLDDPNNDPVLVAKREQQRLDNIRIEELKVKLRDGTITNREHIEFTRLTQT